MVRLGESTYKTRVEMSPSFFPCQNTKVSRLLWLSNTLGEVAALCLDKIFTPDLWAMDDTLFSDKLGRLVKTLVSSTGLYPRP